MTRLDVCINLHRTAPKYQGQLRATKHWHERHDRALLKGLLEHGYGKWSR